MCGIAASFAFDGKAIPLDLRLIHHRGPDSAGEWTSPDGQCWLGNTRLAIVDLSPAGAQPMIDPPTDNVLVVNGEIYNHRALRELLGPDVGWRGTSDTETLLRAYRQWGYDLLDRVKGMFAFAIYDAERRELFIARDRLGIKPLYYTMDAGGLRLASEVRVLENGAQAIEPETISGYLQWGACPERNLLYSDVRSFPAGQAMVVGADGQPREWRYWPNKPAFCSPRGNAPKEVRRLIYAAVNEHLLSDVPVASFLSGGIDSSIITAIAAQNLKGKLQTFTVGFEDEKLDESAIASQIAERYRTTHRRLLLSKDEVVEMVTEAVGKLDLPSVDAINTFIVSRAVASRGIKVALSGLGGDELFGGYSSFRDVWKLKLLGRLPLGWRTALGAVTGISDRMADLPETRNAGALARWRRRFMTDDMIRRAGLPPSADVFDCPVDLPDDFAQISWAELTGYMRRMLLRDADQMSMAVSLEMRVPFLDHELVEYVLGLPAAEKRRGRGMKGLLVEACRDLIPPAVYQRPKRGFVLPMKNWMRGPLESFVETGLEETVSRQLLPESFVAEMRASFAKDRLHWTRLWSIVVLGQFAKRRQLSGSRHEDTQVHALS